MQNQKLELKEYLDILRFKYLYKKSIRKPMKWAPMSGHIIYGGVFLCRKYINIFIVLMFITISCNSRDRIDKEKINEWEFMGLENINLVNIYRSTNCIYAITQDKGLWRNYPSDEIGDWEYLGFSRNDSTTDLLSAIDMVVDHVNPNNIIVTTQYKYSGPIPDHFLYRSNDGGLNWVPADSGLIYSYNGETNWKWLSSIEEVSGYIIGGGEAYGLYKTTDFGISWEEIDNSIISVDGIFLEHPSNSNILWHGGTVSISVPILYLSDDNGESWENINFNGVFGPVGTIQFIGLDRNDENYIIAYSYGIFAHSFDMGVTWNRISYRVFYSLAVMTTDSLVLYASSSDTLYKSNDRANTWEAMDSPNTSEITFLKYNENFDEFYLYCQEGLYVFKNR